MPNEEISIFCPMEDSGNRYMVQTPESRAQVKECQLDIIFNFDMEFRKQVKSTVQFQDPRTGEKLSL